MDMTKNLGILMNFDKFLVYVLPAQKPMYFFFHATLFFPNECPGLFEHTNYKLGISGKMGFEADLA